MMRPRNIRDICLLGALIMFAAPAVPARAQAPVTADDMINRLAGLETAPDLDIAALRQRALDRVKSKTEPVALKRPRVAPELLKLPQLLVEVQFDPDSAIVRPQSYQTLGLIADTLVRAAMLPYGFLIVGRTESAGKREYNLTLSQRRADSIRDVLVTTFKISPKRIQAIGLGEEQLQDANQPASLVNRQIQIVTIAKAP
jgi:outer membrane protein OmpA-like peptidoglycan-associated protein